jgi:hypothetical protein
MALSSSEAGPKADVVGRFCIGCEVIICEFVVHAVDAFYKQELSTRQRDQELARSAELIPEECPEGPAIRTILRTSPLK